MSGSSYEAWVRALRAWADDPTTPLDRLPVLDTSQPPAVFQRLVQHLTRAVQAFTDRWTDHLTTALGQAADSFARDTLMVDAKRLYARRLLLAQHPHLPATLRDVMWTEACADVRGMQDQLEQVARRHQGLRPDGILTELFRRHNLTSLVEPGFPLADFVAGRYREPRPAAPSPSGGSADPDVGLPPGLRGTTPRVLPTW